MGFNKRRMGSEDAAAAAKETEARRALGPQILADAEHLIANWNARQEQHMPMLFSPTIGAAIAARHWFLWVRCPACRTINAVDLRTLDRHHDAAITAAEHSRCNARAAPAAGVGQMSGFCVLPHLSRPLALAADGLLECHRRVHYSRSSAPAGQPPFQIQALSIREKGAHRLSGTRSSEFARTGCPRLQRTRTSLVRQPAAL
jgi:hypothetical protein